MVQKKIIERVGRGLYQLGSRKEFNPIITNEIKMMYNSLTSKFPFAEFCIWQTSIINRLSQHISSHNMLLVEVEKEIAESVFYFIQENFNTPTFINPTEETLNLYVRNKPNSIIIKHIVTEAPKIEVNEVTTISIEKLLVDLFIDKEIFQSYQGHELKHIFINAYNAYSINDSKLIRYASRRGKKDQLVEFQNQIFGNKLK